jgi:probable F420-dependent oxidoreductase
MDVGVSGIQMEHGDITVLAQKMEELGFDSMWVPEHTVIPIHHNSKYRGTADGSLPESMSHQANPLISLAHAAGATKTLKIGTAVLLVTEHNPLDLAKQVSTLDYYSGGRFLFGIGTGWFREESEIMGGDFDHRWTQAREYLSAMKELWTNDPAEYHGEYVDFPPVRCLPLPVQKPHPPVLLGGEAKNVFRRIVQWADGWLPLRMSPEQVAAARATLSEMADAAGRDPKSITITVSGVPTDKDAIKQYEDAGADRALVRLTQTGQSEVLGELEDMAQKVFG